MQFCMESQKSANTSIKNQVTQNGQIAKQLLYQQPTTFDTNTQTYPKEKYNAVANKSDKVSENMDTRIITVIQPLMPRTIRLYVTP